MGEDKIKLAVRKEEGSIRGGGFNYFLHPLKMDNDASAEIFRLMGYIIVEVGETRGEELIVQARAALHHQIEVAWLTDVSEGTSKA